LAEGDVGPHGPDTPKSADDGDKKARFTGESTKETVKTIRVRECRVIPAVTVMT